MKTLDFIGITSTDAKNITTELQQLLADLQIFYTNLRSFHWNIQGDQFFTLHAKFEELYNETSEQVDEVAERILSLGEVPQNKFSEYLKISKLKEVESVSSPTESVKSILEAYKVLIAQERKVQTVADKASDEVTADMMTEYLTAQEKTVWMLVAYSQTGK